ncbi:MAG: TrbI/VirB10 family protein [Verrucomicrobiae bacterium]|nr:TrbI/VirB10 family protein [Verrucomicrobiae bacterium]
MVLCAFIISYTIIRKKVASSRSSVAASKEKSVFATPLKETKNTPHQQTFSRQQEQGSLPGGNLPPASEQPQIQQPRPLPQRQFNQPSFGNINTSSKVMSDDFLPKGTFIYATLTSDIVSNNQVSPATATVIHPTIFAHKIRIPVGTQVTGRIAPGNLRGRVFVTWDTLIFYEEGRQGWELPIRGIGMTYEQNTESGRWFINGAGLKGYLYDDSAANAFKLAALKAGQDFTKTLQTYITTQASAVTAGSVVTTTTTTPQATLQNAGLGAASAAFDVLAQRYAATLQQQNSFVLVPTAKLVAIFLDEPIDITTAAPGRTIQAAK